MRKIAIIALTSLVISIFSNVISVSAIEGNDAPYNIMPDEMHSSYLNKALDPTTSYASDIHEYDNFLTAYYDNLTYNFGVNYKSSCGYIALGMLLSYYDTYLCDDIIPEQYDISSVGAGTNMIERRNSPGVLRDIIENASNPFDQSLSSYSALEYYSVMESMSNISLHAKLLTIGAAWGYYQYNNDDAPALTTIVQLRNIASAFLYNVSHISSSYYNINISYVGNKNTTSNDIKNSTISAIQAGYPVLLLVGSSESVIGHFVVAYDYEPTTDTIYFHLGYGADETHVSFDDTDFSDCWSMMTIDFNMSHSHSRNYGITKINPNNTPATEYYCYDNCDIITYAEKEHSHSMDYISCSNISHNSYCECGDYIVENHVLVDNVCSLCNHVHTHDFAYLPYQSLSHKSLCDICGYYIIEPHITTVGVNNGKTCIRCGSVVGSGGMQLNSAVSISYITDNGSFVRADGIIVLSEIDYLLFLNGELDIDILIVQVEATQK